MGGWHRKLVGEVNTDFFDIDDLDLRTRLVYPVTQCRSTNAQLSAIRDRQGVIVE